MGETKGALVLPLKGRNMYTRPGQTVDRDRPVDRQQFAGRSQVFLTKKKINRN